VGVVGVASLAATGMFKMGASPAALPQTTPARLIAAIQSSDASGFSGTVVSHLSLGLPDLPTLGDTGAGTSFTSLLTGSHTLQVWYGGPDKQRIALLGATDETDLFHSGRNLWEWSSADKLAVHSVLPAGAKREHQPLDDPAEAATTLTPDALARSAIAALDPTTTVAVTDDHVVADRAAYALVLTPRTSATKVGSVHISIDGATKVPLGVQVYARGATSPAIDVAFTSIRFAQPSDRNFTFTPPPGARVRESQPEPATTPAPHQKGAAARTGVQVTGSGWSRVVSVDGAATSLDQLAGGAASKALTPVSGTWGTGRLLDSALMSVLITSDGRVIAGAVQPAQLYPAAGKK
jgi:outer membrane lipoprotein-sorting protein